MARPRFPGTQQLRYAWEKYENTIQLSFKSDMSHFENLVRTPTSRAWRNGLKRRKTVYGPINI
jgi:hypothetical protein